jgi:hypothetical protein
MDTTVYKTELGSPRLLDVIRPREPERLTLQIATTPELMDVVYRLRHDSYVSQGFLEPKVSGLFADEWDRRPHFFSFLSFLDDRPAASGRISICTPAAPLKERSETTAMEIFPDEIFGLAEAFRVDRKPTVVLEVSRLTQHPDFSKSNSDPVFAIFRGTFYSILKADADILISAVRRHHMPFYKRIGFQKITEPRPYQKLKFETALMAGFRPSFPLFQQMIPIFQGTDKADSICERLFAGERVKIFDEMPARAQIR